MKNSEISWTDSTFNPWEGCTKVSPGCAHCYAETRNARFGGGTAPNWGKGAPRRRTSVSNWNAVKKWNRLPWLCDNGHGPYSIDADPKFPCAECGSNLRRARVFCASLADWLDDEVPIEWTADLLDLVRVCTNLDFLLLTKRPQNWRKRVKEVRDFAIQANRDDLHSFVHHWLDRVDLAPPLNIWLGTTVEDQARADERIPQLLSIPARVRFLSCEPLLGPIEFSNVTRRSDCVSQLGKPALAGIDWVICGGESGPDARPMHPDWARSLRDQCAAAGVAFHFKQWGEWVKYIDRDKSEP